MPKRPRLGFAGTPKFAATILQALLDAHHDVVLICTQPDRPMGRGRKLAPSPVKVLAERERIPLHQPERLRSAEQIEPLAAADLDVLIVAAYGLLLPKSVLCLPGTGCINVHASLLPRWRGAAPVERALMAGDAETGISIMLMDEGLDTGGVLAWRGTPITDGDTGAALEQRLAELGATTLVDLLPELIDRSMQPVPQDAALVTYANKLTAADAVIRWSRVNAELANHVRALNDRMYAYGLLGGCRVQVLEAHAVAGGAPTEPGTIIEQGRDLCVACGRGALTLDSIRVVGRGKGGAISGRAARNGFPDLFLPGIRFNEPT